MKQSLEYNVREYRAMQANIFECPDSLATWYCLNGATCFSVRVQDSILNNCWCLSGYHGARCEYKYTSKGGQEQPVAKLDDHHQESSEIANNFENISNGNKDLIQSNNHIMALGLSFVKVPEQQQQQQLGE